MLTYKCLEKDCEFQEMVLSPITTTWKAFIQNTHSKLGVIIIITLC